MKNILVLGKIGQNKESKMNNKIKVIKLKTLTLMTFIIKIVNKIAQKIKE